MMENATHNFTFYLVTSSLHLRPSMVKRTVTKHWTWGCRTESTTYITRHGISHSVPADNLCQQVALDRCLPCLTCGDAEPRPGAWIWYFISSELFVFSLRISAVCFGVVKVTTLLWCKNTGQSVKATTSNRDGERNPPYHPVGAGAHICSGVSCYV